MWCGSQLKMKIAETTVIPFADYFKSNCLPRRQFTTERNWCSVQISLPPECVVQWMLRLHWRQPQGYPGFEGLSQTRAELSRALGGSLICSSSVRSHLLW